ncbi:MAG: hypothetical protein WCV92_02300 [Candidatus Buchananbacteria bacterium]
MVTAKATQKIIGNNHEADNFTEQLFILGNMIFDYWINERHARKA